MELVACQRLVALLEAGRLRCVMSAMALAEITYVLGRERASAHRRAQLASYLSRDLSDRLTVVPVTSDLATAAAEFRLTHNHRERAPISHADALYVVTARENGASGLVTVDGPLLALGDPQIVRPTALDLS